MKIFILTILLMAASFQAGPIEDLNPGEWVEIPNSHLADHLPSPIPPNRGGAKSIMSAWSGAAYDTQRDRLIVWGGGHADYGGNEIYTFDMNTLTWDRPWGPTVDIPPTNSTNQDPYNDGNPASRHTRDGIEYVPTTDKFWTQCGGIYPQGGANEKVWEFDFDSNTWTHTSNLARTTWFSTGSAAFDPVTQKLYFQGLRNFLEINPVTGASVARGRYGPGLWQTETTAEIDPENRLFINVGAGNCMVWDMSVTPFAMTMQSTTGGDEVVNAKAPGFAYDTVTKQFVAWTGSGSGSALADVFILNTTTWVWTRHAPAATNTVIPTSATGTGTYGRFRYVPSKNVFVLVNSIYENVFVYKLSQDPVSVGRRPSQTRAAFEIMANPNPFKSAVCISLSYDVRAAFIESGASTRRMPPLHVGIYNTNGRLVHQTKFNGNAVTWNPAAHPAGIYLVKATVNGKTLTKKLFLQR